MTNIGESGIRVTGVSKSYGPVHALDDISFVCPSGSITGLLGPNGSGKSTAMRVMVGLANADSGSIAFDGVAYVNLERPGTIVGAVLDPSAHHPGRSVEETLATAAILMGLPLARSRELVDALGLDSARRRRFGALSLGMKQRVALAVALLGRPRHLILDEPMNGLDIETGAWLRETLVHHAHSAGGSVLVSTHLLLELQSFADRIVVLSQGRVAHTGEVGGMGEVDSATVVAVEPDRMREALERRGIESVFDPRAARFHVKTSPRVISEICLADGILVDELTGVRESIRDIYERLTHGEHRAEGVTLERR